MHSMEIVCSELKMEDELAVANVNEGDRLAFVTHFHGQQTLLPYEACEQSAKVSVSCILT